MENGNVFVDVCVLVFVTLFRPSPFESLTFMALAGLKGRDTSKSVQRLVRLQG